MESVKTNKALYQDNAVELDDEALAKIIGGCDEFNNCNQPGQGDWNHCQGQNNGWGRGQHRGDHSLLRALLGDPL